MSQEQPIVTADTDISQLTPEQLDQALAQPDDVEEQQAAPEATTGAAEEPAAAAEAKTDPTVPIGALHEERMKRKDAERALAQERARAAALEQTLRVGNERIGRVEQVLAAQLTPQAPDPTTDPLGYQSHQVEKLAGKVDALARQNDDQSKRAQEERMLAQFDYTVRSQEAMFKQEHPDYDRAIAFVKEKRAAQLIALGAPESEAQRLVDREGAQIAAMALSRGESVPDVAYRLAVATGYQQGSAAVAPAQKLEMQQRGQSASKPSGAAAPGGRVTMESLAAMPMDEFEKIANDPKEWKRIMGG